MKNWRIKRSVVAASMLCVLAGSTVWAEQGAPPGELETLKRMIQEVMSQNEELRRRVRDLEAAIGKQQPVTKETAKDAPREPAKEAPTEVTKEAPREPAKEAAKEIATQPVKEAIREAVREAVKEAKGLWGKIQLGGAIEVDLLRTRDFIGPWRSDIQLTTAEFDFEANLVDWAKATLALSWDGDQDKFTLEEALVVLGDTEAIPFFLRAGRGTVPFGISTGSTVAARLEDTLTLTDPLDLEVFDAKQTYALLGVRTHGFNAGFYVYQGQTNDVGGGGKRLDHYGANVAYGMRNDLVSFTAGFSMISSVFDSEGLRDAFPGALTPGTRYTPGIAAYGKFGLAGFSLVGAYYGALRPAQFIQDDNLVRLQPKAWHVEGGYTREIFGAKTFAALSYSETYQLAGKFPKTRKIVTLGRWFLDNMLVSFDYAHDEDYARASGGTGRLADRFTLRLTYEW